MIRILASDEQKREILQRQVDEAQITWVANLAALIAEPAQVYMDLQFEPSPQRVSQLRNCLPAHVIIHSVAFTLETIGVPFIRVNAWPGFLEREILEAAVPLPGSGNELGAIAAILNRECMLLPDKPGFVSARVLAMIINEAYFALEEGVSGKREIDIAMKTGTNYPYGPFEWCNKVGIHNVLALLNQLALTDTRYQPSALLMKEAGSDKSTSV